MKKIKMIEYCGTVSDMQDDFLEISGLEIWKDLSSKEEYSSLGRHRNKRTKKITYPIVDKAP